MKKTLFIFVLFFSLSAVLPVLAHADTAQEAEKGRELTLKLGSKEITCDNLSDNDFESIGEYYMEKMIGTSHGTMNEMMEQMMGEEGEQGMHIVMGKRMSDCDSASQLPQNMMDMMRTKMGNYGAMGQGMMTSGMMGFGNMMGGNFYGWNWTGLLFQLLFFVLIILAAAALIKFISKK